MRCVDTTFLIDILNEEPSAYPIMNELDDCHEYITTAVNRFELLAGARQLGSRSLEAADQLLARFQVLQFDTMAADEAAAIYAQSRMKGREVPMRDAMVAAIASLNGCSLVTRDSNHFNRIPNLEVIPY